MRIEVRVGRGGEKRGSNANNMWADQFNNKVG